MWLAANPDWPRDEDGNLIERFRTQTNSVLPGFAPRRLCRLLATVGDTSTIESDLMPLLDRKEKIGTYPTSAPGHRRQPVRDYVSSPRLCDWACDSILTIVGIRVSKAYDQAAMDLGALELTARNLPGRSVFRAGEDKLHFKGFTSTFDFSDATRLDSAGKLTSSDTLTTTVSTPHLHVSDNVIRIRDRMLENLRAE